MAQRETLRERLSVVETTLKMLEKQNNEDHKKMIETLEELKNFKITVVAIASVVSLIITGVISWLGHL